MAGAAEPPYQKPPAYMAYPPFKEPNWRYELGSRSATTGAPISGWISSDRCARSEQASRLLLLTATTSADACRYVGVENR